VWTGDHLDVEAEQKGGAALGPVLGGLVAGLEVDGNDERRPLASSSTSRVVVRRARVDTSTHAHFNIISTGHIQPKTNPKP